MLNSIDSSLFYLLNEYLRNPIFDYILPFFSYSLPLLAGVGCFFFFFSLYCLKIYGDALWRVLALAITIAVSLLISESGAFLLKDMFERNRPYEALQATNYFQEDSYSWVQILKEAPKNASKNEELVTAESIVHDSITNKAIVSEGLASETIDSKPIENKAEIAETINSEGLNSKTIEENTPIDSITFENSAQEEAQAPLLSLEAQLPIDGPSQNNIYPYLTYDVAQKDGIFEETTASMPSAFAANVMAVTFIIALLFPKTAPWIYFLPLLTGWARIYTGNSYPMDIIIGWLWGILAVAIAWFICEFIFRKVVLARRI